MSNNKRIIKTALSVTLGLSIMFSGSALLTSGTAHAATYNLSTQQAASTQASNIISLGKSFMGTPYKFGAKTGSTSSFDCSSFMQYIFRANGVSIPRSSKQQSTAGSYVSRNNLQPGDLVFFYSPIHHVALYIGNGKILHTYGSPGVTISNLNSGWWNDHYSTARRVL